MIHFLLYPTAGVHRIGLFVGGIVWLLFGMYYFRNRMRERRLGLASYLLGGAMIVVYEIHMDWYWLVIGLFLILAGIVAMPRSNSSSTRATLHRSGQRKVGNASAPGKSQGKQRVGSGRTTASKVGAKPSASSGKVATSSKKRVSTSSSQSSRSTKKS
ncbi:MAG: hypothetical protein OWQ59_02510 [Alicyclobacillaceae bacterium]|nr:hypothetical protein [Alicyclobacillaceae bacterium]